MDPDAELPDDVVERMEAELRDQDQRAAAGALVAKKVARDGRGRLADADGNDSEATIGEDEEGD